MSEGEEWRAEDWVLLPLSLGLLMGQILAVIFHIYPHSRSWKPGGIPALRKQFIQCMESARATFWGLRSAEDALSEATAREIQDWRLAHARRMNAVLSLYYFGILSSSIGLRFSGLRRWMSPPQDLVILATYAGVLFCGCFPKLLNMRTHYFWYSFIMSSFVTFMLMSSHAPEMMPLILLFGLLPRLLVAMSSQGALVLVWNILYSLAACYSYSLGDQTGLAPKQYFYATEFGVFLLLMMVMCMTTALKLREIVQSLEAATWKKEKSAAVSLLESICDVVVELDGDLRLVDDARRLAGVLLQSSGRSLRGVEFCHFLPTEEERKEFQERMLPAEEGSSLARVFHARLRDANSNIINMELFHVQFEDLSMRPHHLLGVREFGDVEAVVQYGTAGQDMVRQLTDTTTDSPLGAGSPASPGGATLPAPPGASPREEQQWNGSERSHDLDSRGPRRVGSSRGRAGSSSEASSREGLLPTTSFAKETMLLSTLMRWSFPGRRCCHYHASVSELRKIVLVMEKRECLPSFGRLTGWQCQHCGTCDLDDTAADPRTGRCEVCVQEESIAPKASSAVSL